MPYRNKNLYSKDQIWQTLNWVRELLISGPSALVATKVQFFLSDLSTAILLVFVRLAATDENITYQPPNLLKKKNSVLLLHPIRKPYFVNTVPSTHTENFTWNHIYRPKPAKISTQSCGTERWRLWGRYYVTNRQNFSSSSDMFLQPAAT